MHRPSARLTAQFCRGGAFGDAIDKLSATGLVPVIREQAAQKPLLGICLGMQLLFEKSYEYGEHAGLGFVKGEVCPLEPDLKDKTLKVPQIGWNALHIVRDDPLFRYIREGEYVYYVHSYYGKKLYREYTCCQRLLHPRDRRGQGGQGVRHPVPPGKERRYRAADPQGVQRIVSGLALSVTEQNDFKCPPLALWAYLAEKLFLISRLSRPAGRSKRIFTRGVIMYAAISSH